MLSDTCLSTVSYAPPWMCICFSYVSKWSRGTVHGPWMHNSPYEMASRLKFECLLSDIALEPMSCPLKFWGDGKVLIHINSAHLTYQWELICVPNTGTSASLPCGRLYWKQARKLISPEPIQVVVVCPVYNELRKATVAYGPASALSERWH